MIFRCVENVALMSITYYCSCNPLCHLFEKTKIIKCTISFKCGDVDDEFMRSRVSSIKI